MKFDISRNDKYKNQRSWNMTIRKGQTNVMEITQQTKAEKSREFEKLESRNYVLKNTEIMHETRLLMCFLYVN